MFHSAHGIRFKLVSNWEQSMLYTKSLYVLHATGISMLTGLKVLSLTCKCVFYRPELNAKAGYCGRTEKFLSEQRNTDILPFKRWNFDNGSSEVRNPLYFLKLSNKTLQMPLNIFPKLELIFCCIQQKVYKT